jgi:acyl carrier protein
MKKRRSPTAAMKQAHTRFRCRSKDEAIKMDIRTEIMGEFKQVAQEHGHNLAPLVDNLALVGSGLDSLGFAVVVARLEDRLGVDPFNDSEGALFPVTFGEFIQCYENAAIGKPAN